MAPSGECLRGKNPPDLSDRMLAKPWCRLFLAAFGLKLGVVAVLRDRLLWGSALCPNHNKEDDDYYYYYLINDCVICTRSYGRQRIRNVFVSYHNRSFRYAAPCLWNATPHWSSQASSDTVSITFTSSLMAVHHLHHLHYHHFQLLSLVQSFILNLRRDI